MKFKQYKKYVTKKEDDSHNTHKFYEVTSSEILEAEDRLGIRFPRDLRNFYENIGYGFIYSNKKESINRIIDPHSVADIRLREDVYEYNSEIDEYVDENQLLFFEVVEGLFLSVTLDTQKIYYADHFIAENLEELLTSIDNNHNYIFEKLGVDE